MKSKSKVEVVEPVSVANQCDYQRTNGKCGRALCEHFGKECAGRACEDWTCDAEGENAETPCIHFGGEDYCPDYRADKITCDKCPKWLAEHENGIPGAVAVVEPTTSNQQPSTNYRDRVSGQYAAIGTAKDNLMRECVKFGALLTEVSYYLGETQGRKGAGLQTWLEENCPEINYKTAMGYKSAAAKFVKMIGGGSQAVAVLQDKTEVIPPGEDAPIEVDAKFIEKRDQLFNDVKSRRELEQTYFKFMAHEGKGRQGGANKGQSGTGRRALTAEEKSDAADVEIRELVGKISAFDKSGKFRMLTAQTQSDIILALKDVVKSFEEQQVG